MSKLTDKLVGIGEKPELSPNPDGSGYVKQLEVDALSSVVDPKENVLYIVGDKKYKYLKEAIIEPGTNTVLVPQGWVRVENGPESHKVDGERGTPQRVVTAPRVSFEKIYQGKVAFNDDVFVKGKTLAQYVDEHGGASDIGILPHYNISGSDSVKSFLQAHPEVKGQTIILRTADSEMTSPLIGTFRASAALTQFAYEFEKTAGPERYVSAGSGTALSTQTFSDIFSSTFRKDYALESKLPTQWQVTLPAMTVGQDEIGYNAYFENRSDEPFIGNIAANGLVAIMFNTTCVLIPYVKAQSNRFVCSIAYDASGNTMVARGKLQIYHDTESDEDVIRIVFDSATAEALYNNPTVRPYAVLNFITLGSN